MPLLLLLALAIVPAFGVLAKAQTNQPSSVSRPSDESHKPFGLSEGTTWQQVEAIVGRSSIVKQEGDDVTYSTASSLHPDFGTYINPGVPK